MMTDSSKKSASEKQRPREDSPPAQPRDNPPPPYQQPQPNYYPYGMPAQPPPTQPFWAYPAIPAPRPAADDAQRPSIPIHSRPTSVIPVKSEYGVDEKRRPAPPPKPYYGALPPGYNANVQRLPGNMSRTYFQSPPHPSQLQGNYTSSSRRITLTDTHDLVAECTTLDGMSTKLSAYRLDRCLTNNNGHFQWVRPGIETGNFGASARNVRLVEGGRWLEAELCRLDRQWQWDRVCLDERIENQNGCLRKI
jgi:hypothetical protein